MAEEDGCGGQGGCAAGSLFGGASLPHMPHEVTAGISWCLSVRDVRQLAPCCRVLAQEVGDPELWFHLFMRTCWPASPALLAFAEDGAASPSSVDWRKRLQKRVVAPPAIVVDVGRGYTKYGIVHGFNGRPEGDGFAPVLVQLCSSPTHPPDCDREEQLQYIHHCLDLRLATAAADRSSPLHEAAVLGARPSVGGRAILQTGEHMGRYALLKSFEAGTNLWTVDVFDTAMGGREGRRRLSAATLATLEVAASDLLPFRAARELPLLVGEPFAVTASRRDESIGCSGWAMSVRSQLTARPGPVRIAPQAQMSLWAHGIDHGIVVNIGQGQTFAIPVVNGEVCAGDAISSNIGSATLTMAMVQFLSARFPFVDSDLMTWCRDLKETYCYVAPPAPGVSGRSGPSLRARLQAGDDFGVQRIELESPINGETLELAEERVLVPEMLFDPSGGARPTLPELIVGCAERVRSRNRCGPEGLQKLLQQVVLVGGAADLPGIRPRTEFEVRALLRESGTYQALAEVMKSPDDMFVLNPPLGTNGPITSPRFVPFIGGCVRAASALHFDVDADSADGEGSLASRRHSSPVVVPTRAPFTGNGITAWIRRRLNLNGPVIFRTGGGGGEDDTVWDQFQDPEAYSSMSASESEESAGEGEDESEPEPSTFAAAAGGASAAASARAGAESSDEDKMEEEEEEESPRSPAGDDARGSRWRGGGKGQRSGKGKGKGGRGGYEAARARGRGRGGSSNSPSQQRVWRPVQR